MFDISQEEDYRELTLEEQYLVNGGERIENSDAAVAAGAPGDVLKRNDGSEVVITQGDINAAQKKLGLTGSGGNPGEGNGGVTGSGGNNNTTTSGGGPSGSPGGSGPESGGSDNRGYPSSMDGYYDAKLKKLHEYNPDETNTDKKFTARDFNGKHLMTVYYANGVKFEDAAAYYLSFGKWGTAGTTTYDGIGLTDEKGNIVHILTEETAIKKYADSLNPLTKQIEKGKTYSCIENNQLKTEKDLYFKAKSSRDGWEIETGVTKVDSKTLVQGPAGEAEVSFLTAEAAWIDSPKYTKRYIGASIISLDGEIGFQLFGKRFTIGGGIGTGLGIGYTRTENSISGALGPFTVLFTVENY